MDNRVNYVVIGDIHVGKKDDRRLADELEKHFTEYIKLHHEREGLELIVVAGDLFDRIVRLNEFAGIYAVSFMRNLVEWSYDNNILVRILKGTKTHDYNQLDALNDIEKDYPNFKIIRKVEKEDMILNDNNFNVLYLPEEYPTDPDNYYEEYFNVEDKTYDMIFGHGMIDFVAFTGYEDDSENPVRHTPTHKADELIRLSKGPVLFG